ncbi:MAG: hypothetical protein QF368_19045 [SAR202 cluster bacterium]|jgi:hypothetical protein|nr:hypothetical protein [SAR202 cluster bacterium]
MKTLLTMFAMSVLFIFGASVAFADDTTIAVDPEETDPYILVIHSNVAEGVGDPGLTAGHAWLTLHSATSGEMIHSYGLWPDTHPDIVAAGLANGDASDVRTDFVGDAHLGTYYHAVSITAEEMATLEASLAEDWDWVITCTCASLASEVFYEVTGVDIDADEFLGFETPREIGEHIIEANGGTATPTGTPPSAPDDDGTSTSADDEDDGSSSSDEETPAPAEADDGSSSIGAVDDPTPILIDEEVSYYTDTVAPVDDYEFVS